MLTCMLLDCSFVEQTDYPNPLLPFGCPRQGVSRDFCLLHILQGRTRPEVLPRKDV